MIILGSKFKQTVKDKALKICSEPDCIQVEKVSIVHLQISTEPASLNKALGHGHHRKDIAEHFRKEPLGNVLDTEVFEELNRQLQSQLQQHCVKDPEEKKSFLQKHGNLVVIAGQPGIGKSTLTKCLVKKMWNSEAPLFDPDIVFFIRFRDLNYKRKTTLLQFLAPFVSDELVSKDNGQEILKKIKESDKVYIIMDGLDEASIDPRMNKPECFEDSRCDAEHFIQNLIAGNILPQSKKVITSRPHRIAQLPKDYQPRVLFTIQGLDDEALKEICLNVCGEKNTLYHKILVHLESIPDLKSYCHTPVICIMVLKTLRNMYASENGFNETSNEYTLTAIFVFVLKEWLVEKLERKGEFQCRAISHLAFKGFAKNQFYFRKHQLKKANVDFENITTFFNTIIKGNDKLMHFIHLMWEEFLAAVKLRLFTSKKEFKRLYNNLGSAKYEVVTLFLFGLCHKETLNELLDCTEFCDYNTVHDRKVCKEMLMELAVKKLRKQRDADQTDDSDEDTSDDDDDTDDDNGSDGNDDDDDDDDSDDDDHDDSDEEDDSDDSDDDDDDVSSSDNNESDDDSYSDDDDDKRDDGSYFQQILPMLRWVREMGNEGCTKQAAASLRDNLHIEKCDQILPSDVPSVNYVLRSCDDSLMVKMHNPTFVGNCAQYFFKEFNSTLKQNPNIQVS